MTGEVTRLGDLGERRIIRELLGRRYGNVENFGDDAATVFSMPPGEGVLVATTDPCPPPMAEALGATDQFYAGWLLTTLNLSDLAAAGADPIALVTSLVLTSDMEVTAFERLLDGIDACCAAVGAAVVGGNLKEGKARDLTATAIGFCPDRQPLRRSGASIGDSVVVIGGLGEFWAGVLAVQRNFLELESGDPLCANILTPLPKNAVMSALAKEGLVGGSTDNSDGLYPSFVQLAFASGCAIRLSGEAFAFSDAVRGMSARLQVDPLRLALGWGDWQTIVTCTSSQLDDVLDIASSFTLPACVVGVLEPGDGVLLDYGGEVGLLMSLDSQRFTRDSWFTSGLEGYIRMLLDAPLIQTQGRDAGTA